jgi:hypothetical protein
VAGPVRRLLLIGALGLPLPEPDPVATALRPLARWLDDDAALLLLGSEPPRVPGLAQRVADRLGVAVPVRHGDPWRSDSRWQPFVSLSTYLPGGSGTRVDAWRLPVPGPPPCAAGSYPLPAGWVLDLVPAGMVARPSGQAPEPGPRGLPCHPDWAVLVVDSDSTGRIPDPVLTELGRLADRLPSAARFRLRVLTGSRVCAQAAAALRRAVPAPTRPWSEYLPPVPVQDRSPDRPARRAPAWFPARGPDPVRLRVEMVGGRLLSRWSDDLPDPDPGPAKRRVRIRIRF